MKSTGLRTASPGAREDASRRLIVSPHHPDVLQRRSVRGANPSLTQALTWNVFRTLELLPPAFRLRRVNAALGIDLPRPAPVIAQVRLWPTSRVRPWRRLSSDSHRTKRTVNTPPWRAAQRASRGWKILDGVQCTPGNA